MKQNNSYKNLIKETIVALIPCIFLFLMNIFYIGINYHYGILLITRKAMITEIIIIYSLCFLLLGLFKKAKTTINIIGFFLLVLSIINQIKYAFMGEPVLFSDILYLGNTGEIFGIIKGEFLATISLYIPSITLEIAWFSAFMIFGNVLSKDMNLKNTKIRICLIIIPIIVLLLLFLPFHSINNFVLDKIYGIKDRKDYKGSTSIGEYYLFYGIIGGMHDQLLEDRIQKPSDYDENVVNKELTSAKENKNKIFDTPNIIVVFSESFWDIDQLEEVEFNKDITPNFNKLKEKGLFFNMISPSYGGISANIEYEFLTGSNVMYFNRGYVPYMQLFKNKSYYDRPSIIKDLKNNGYKTKMVTWTSPYLFNCGKVYEYLQFDETEYNYNYSDENVKGFYVSDEYVTNKIIKDFDNKVKGQKLFYMTLTMQSHMPYVIGKYNKYDVWVTNSKFSQNENNVLTSYAQGIYDADKQLGRLYDYINTIDEPTLIVFYGDHLPYLYSGKDNIIDYLDYFNTDDEKVNIYRKYNTQSLIIGNFDFNKEEETKYLGPDLLSSYILSNMNIKISDYYKWLYNSKDIIGSANYLVTVDKEGNLYNTNQLEGNMKKVYDLRRNIEYKLFVK